MIAIKPTIINVALSKVPASKPVAKGKGKRVKGKKYPSARDYAKKQPQVRKAEKGKDYGWLDFLGLPKMKLPDFLGFNSDKQQKAAEATNAAKQAGEQVRLLFILIINLLNHSHHQSGIQVTKCIFQGIRGKRRILKKHRLTPGLSQTT